MKTKESGVNNDHSYNIWHPVISSVCVCILLFVTLISILIFNYYSTRTILSLCTAYVQTIFSTGHV